MAANMNRNEKENGLPILYPLAGQAKKSSRSAGVGGGLSCAVGNCFAQQTNGRRATLTPSPMAKIGHQGLTAEDKENSNIEAALEGIATLKEVLSRKNSAHELDVEVTSKSLRMRHNHVKPPRADTPPVRILAKLENIMSESARPSPNQSASEASSAFTLKDAVAGVGTPGSTPTHANATAQQGHMQVTPPTANSAAFGGFVDLGPLNSSSSSAHTPVKQVSPLAKGVHDGSPTSMLVHSLFLKAQERAGGASDGEAGGKGLGGRAQAVAGFLGALALVALCRMAGGSRTRRRI